MHSSAAMIPRSTPEKLLVCTRATPLVSPRMFDVHLQETNIAYYTPSLSFLVHVEVLWFVVCCMLTDVFTVVFLEEKRQLVIRWLIRRLCPYHGEFEKVINPYTRKFAIQGECGKCVFLVISLIGRAWTQLDYCRKGGIENWVPIAFCVTLNPFVSSMRRHFKVWNLSVILPFLISET